MTLAAVEGSGLECYRIVVSCYEILVVPMNILKCDDVDLILDVTVDGN